MQLSGWTRLWIVAAVIWWGAGAWWLTENRVPDYVVSYPVNDAGERFLTPEAAARRRKAEADYWRIMSQPRPDRGVLDATLKDFPDTFESDRDLRAMAAKSGFEGAPTDRDYVSVASEDWTRWNLAAGLILVVPFGLLILFALIKPIVFWVLRGFVPKA